MDNFNRAVAPNGRVLETFDNPFGFLGPLGVHIHTDRGLD